MEIELPEEILTIICNKLHLPDQVRFRAVCKTWRIEWRKENPDRFIVAHVGNNGWVLLLGIKINGRLKTVSRKGSLFFHNTLTHALIPLPDIEIMGLNDFGTIKATFTSDPTSPNCEVLVLYRDRTESGGLGILRYCCASREEGWEDQLLEYSSGDYYCSVHYKDGYLHCLAVTGQLKTYSLADKSWMTLAKPLRGYRLCGLIENDENFIMAVGKRRINHGGCMTMLKLDLSERTWVPDFSLKNTGILICGKTAISAPLVGTS